MRISCVVCGNALPPWHEKTRSDIDFCSLECAVQSGATIAQVTELKQLREAHTPRLPTPKS
jgi:hypothetical protein